MGAISPGGVVLPGFEAEFVLELERHVKPGRRTRGLALVQPLLGSPVGVEGDLIAALQEAMRREESCLSGTDDGDAAHSALLEFA